jgi:hypothetical protein
MHKSFCAIGVPLCAFCERLAFARRRGFGTWHRDRCTSRPAPRHGHAQRTSRAAQSLIDRGKRHATAPRQLKVGGIVDREAEAM